MVNSLTQWDLESARFGRFTLFEIDGPVGKDRLVFLAGFRFMAVQEPITLENGELRIEGFLG